MYQDFSNNVLNFKLHQENKTWSFVCWDISHAQWYQVEIVDILIFIQGTNNTFLFPAYCLTGEKYITDLWNSTMERCVRSWRLVRLVIKYWQVLNKLPVAQHFLFGSIFNSSWDRNEPSATSSGHQQQVPMGIASTSTVFTRAPRPGPGSYVPHGQTVFAPRQIDESEFQANEGVATVAPWALKTTRNL